MRKLITGSIFVVLAVLMLAACGSSNTPTKANETTVGTWKTDGYEADITSSTITIYLVNQDTRGLYWKGTWSDGSSTVTSTADKTALDSSLFGSQDSTKDFHVQGGKIEFEMGIMGTTRKINLEKTS